MSKYIDADALLKRLREFTVIQKLTKGELLTTAIKEVIEMPAADVEPVRKWISCGEKLPEQESNVIAYKRWEGLVSHKVRFEILIAQLDYRGKWRDNYGVREINGNVVAWMPLPEPPEINGGSE